MNGNKEQLRTRMRDLREVLLDHDHRDGPDDGCVCAALYEEINQIWHVLNDGKPNFVPRAGPRPPSGDEYSVALDNWTFLKNTEPQDED